MRPSTVSAMPHERSRCGSVESNRREVMRNALAPHVGVVIGNHNNQAFIGEAIESVACQTVRDIEVVIVDDASTDESDDVIRRVLARLADNRFRYVRLDCNRGQAGAIRRGLMELSTPFVCFLDSDDVWYENFVARQLAAHLNADFPVALTYCDSHVVNAESRILAGTAWWFDIAADEPPDRVVNPLLIPDIEPGTGRVTYAGNPAMMLYKQWSPEWSSNSMASMMFRRSFVDLVLVSPDDELRLYVDFYLSTLAALLTGAIAIREVLYAYRMHGGNKHSNGAVLGGAYNPSKKLWEPIRDSIIHQVVNVLNSEADSLRDAFGRHRHEKAVAQMRVALRNGRSEQRFNGRSRLHELFWSK
jgi:glycosyltransferase involved in cell wall biosynthesis